MNGAVSARRRLTAPCSPLRQCDFGLLVSISRCRSSFRTGHAVGRLRLCSYRPLSRCSPGGWTAALERLSEAKIDPPQSPFARAATATCVMPPKFSRSLVDNHLYQHKPSRKVGLRSKAGFLARPLTILDVVAVHD